MTQKCSPDSFILANGRLVFPHNIEQGQIFIENGRIAAIGPRVECPKGVEAIDLGGLFVFPGIIDAHVHLRDFNHSHREDLETGTRAVAVGGVTTVLDMPNSDPPVISPKTFYERSARAERVSYVNFGMFGWASSETIATMLLN